MSKWTWPRLLKFLKGSKIDKIKEIENNGKDFEFNIKGTFIDMSAKQEKGFNETQKKELIEIINAVVNPRFDRIEQRLERIESCPTIKKELKK